MYGNESFGERIVKDVRYLVVDGFPGMSRCTIDCAVVDEKPFGYAIRG